MINEQLIRDCQQMKRPAQRMLYEQVAPKLYHTCRRYLRHPHEVEDVLAETCFIILTKIGQLKEVQAFEGWAKRIAVHECLAYLKKKTSFAVHMDEDAVAHMPDDNTPIPMASADLMALVHQLPDGCKAVFNLYVIEGYTHREIAELLGISEGTSKSQLSFSRKKLQEMVQTFYDQSFQRHEQSR